MALFFNILLVFTICLVRWELVEAEGERVVGGNDSPKEKFTWVARLENEKKTLMCSGALIHRRYVLVPKQCVSKEYQREGLKVILGDYNQAVEETSEQHIMVNKVIPHRDPRGRVKIDAAILSLNKSATITKHVTVITMAAKGVPFGTLLKLTGWGIRESEGNVSHVAKQLQVATIPKATRRNCTDEGLNIRSKSESCIGTDDVETYVGPCHGDEGGSIALRDTSQTNNFVLQGLVVINHMMCPSDKRYAVILSVPKIKGWILDRMGCNLPGTWTEYFDMDDPRDKEKPFGDFERARKIKPCGENKNPLCAKYEVKPTGACADVTSRCARNQKFKINRWGLFCENRKQVYYRMNGVRRKCSCCDYTVSFKCPSD